MSRTARTAGPDVTVVVIVHDDAERVGTAIRSALAQTLRSVEVVVVDDASTDGSARVAERIAARHRDRMRVVRLPRNSGGCSRPRNVGLDDARGTYVMFLDSDDTLRPDACRVLFTTARETGAELVSGRCVRVRPEGGDESVWCPKLFERPFVVDGVRDRPDLLGDTLSTNKLYLRSFLDRAGMRFPEGLHYEDLLFSAHAYVAAKRIAVVPDRVYDWHVRRHGPASISNRRADLRNFADRVEVHRRIDRLLLDRGDDDLKLHKDVKFLDHDLQLYLSDLRTRGPEYRRGLLAVAGAYLTELDPAAFDDAKPMNAIAAFFVLQGDEERTVVASDFAGLPHRRGRLLSDLVERDGRVYWTDAYLDDELGRAVLDVTDLDLARLPFDDFQLGNELRTMAVAGSRLELSGELVNPLGRIPADVPLRGRLELFDLRHRERVVGVPVRVEHGPRRIAWAVELDVTRRLRPIGLVDPAWGIRLRLDAGDQTITSRLTADHVYRGAELPVRPRIGREVGDHVETQLTDGGLLGLRVVARGALSRAATGTARRLGRTRAGRATVAAVLAAERRLLAGLRALR